MRRVSAVAVLSWIAVAGAASVWGDAPPAPPQASDSKEKKKGKKKPVPVYTDKDLEKARTSPTASVTVLAGGAPGPAATPEASPAAASSDEESWRKKADEARAAITAAEQRLATAESTLGGLRADREPTNVMDPNRQQTLDAARRAAEAELTAAQQGVEAARKALADLEEEARRKGIPPGWLREK